MNNIKARIECIYVETYNSYFVTVYFNDDIMIRIPTASKEDAMKTAKEYINYLKEGMN